MATKTLTREATFDLTTRKATPTGSRRYPATLSSEQGVDRLDGYGDSYVEVLRHTPDSIDLSRAPLPLLEGHDVRRTNIGIVEGLHVEGGKLKGVIVLGKSARALELADDIDAGIVTGLSIGYRPETYVESTDGNRTVRTFTRWSVHELSIVAVPADIAAGIGRNLQNPNRSTTEKTMDPKNTTTDAATLERDRISQIRALASSTRLDAPTTNQLIAAGVSIDEARNQVIDIMAARSEAFLTDGQGSAGVAPSFYGRGISMGATADEKWSRAVKAAMISRSTDGQAAVSRAVSMNLKGFEKADCDGGGEFRSYSLSDLAAECLERRGIRTRGMSRDRVVEKAFSQRSGGYAGTSDFPVILESALHKQLSAAYLLQNATFPRFTKSEIVQDFRAAPRYRTGSLGFLSTVAENAEYQNLSIPDGEKSTIQTETKGAFVQVSRQLIVNDDMGALSDLFVKAGRSAKMSVEREVYALLAMNGGLGPTMGDSNPFFHASRGNISAGGALAVAGIDTDRQTMRAQKDVAGVDWLDLSPTILLVPTGLETAAKIINESASDFTGGVNSLKPNPVRGMFTDIVSSPRLTASVTRRYAFCDPSVAAGIVVCFLDENGDQPVIQSEDGWRTDGTTLKIRFDFKAQVFDPKASITSAGT